MATFDEYAKNAINDQTDLARRINAVAKELAKLSDDVKSIADDSEANAQAITELAEIVGG